MKLAQKNSEVVKRSYVSSSVTDNSEATDLYNAMSTGDGGDAYMGDGIWIKLDGSVDDKGR